MRKTSAVIFGASLASSLVLSACGTLTGPIENAAPGASVVSAAPAARMVSQPVSTMSQGPTTSLDQAVTVVAEANSRNDGGPTTADESSPARPHYFTTATLAFPGALAPLDGSSIATYPKGPTSVMTEVVPIATNLAPDAPAPTTTAVVASPVTVKPLPVPAPVPPAVVAVQPVVAAAPSVTVPPTTPATPPVTVPPTTSAPSPVVTVPPTPAPGSGLPSDPGAAARFATDINQLRAGLGLAPLTRSPDLNSRALAWAQVLAADGVLRHSTIIHTLVQGQWQGAAENIGYGPSEAVVFSALAASSGHYTNMVNPAYTAMGTAVVVAGNTIWTVHLFVG